VYTHVYLYTRVYTYESTCSAPRHGAYPGPRRARECASPTPRRPRVEGAHGTARPRPRRRRGRRRVVTRRRPASDSRGAGGQRASAARPPPDHEPKRPPRRQSPTVAVHPSVRVFLTFVQQLFCTNFRSFRSNFRSIVFAQGTSAARPGEFPKLLVSPFFAWPSVAFDDPSTCCCIACVRRLCARRASPRAGQRSPVVCVCLSRQYFHRKTEERCVIVLRSNTDIWSWAGGSSKRQDESSERGLSLNRSQRGNCSTEYNTPLGT
jgi:hypothetical protein